MKFILKINGTESPKAAYVGWTPAECTLEIEDHSGETPIPVTITTGHDGFEGRISLYESNATSAQPIDKIEHTFQADDKFTFYVAGKYPNASVGKKDTFVKVESSGGGVPELITKVMVRVRKNANSLSPQEIEAFLTSFVNLNNLPPRETYPTDPFVVTPSKLLHEIVLMHTYDAMFEIHRRTSFHPWHRAFLLHLEREMQEVYPHVTIPYWKFDEKAENVFTTGFIGKTPKSDSGSFRADFDTLNPLYTYQDHTAWGPMQRTYVDVDPAVGKSSQGIFTESQIIDDAGSPAVFLGWSNYEERSSHNQAHGAFGGHVADVGRDPIDPLFFMMHSNVDRLWAKWQDKRNRFDSGAVETYPFQDQFDGKRGQEWADENPDKFNPNFGFYRVDNTDIGNFAEDTLWPWSLDQELSRPMRTWLDEDGPSLVPQINIKFPDSLTSSYPEGSLTVKSTIDYQDRINNQVYLGFDYDNLPYFEHDRIPMDEIPMPNIESSNKDFLDSNLPAAERLRASDNVFLQNDDERGEALNILSNKEEEMAIRLKSIALIDETTEAFLDTALKIIADPTEPDDLRFGLIHRVFTAKRSNLHFPSRKPLFFNILRGLIRDSDEKIRLQSISILAAQEDPVVQQFLIGELEKDESEYISKPDAIFFLRQNIKPQHAKLFRALFEQSKDPEVRKAAIAGLGNDPDSTDLLEKTVLDENESFKIREAGALSLHNIDRKKMNELAARLLSEPAADEGGEMLLTASAPDPDEVDFKAGLMNMLVFTGDIDRLKQDEELKASLRQVVDKSTGDKSGPAGSLEGLADPDAVADETPGEPSILEQMAAKLLNKFEASDEGE